MTCAFPDCGRDVFGGRGLCRSHNDQARTNRPLRPLRARTADETVDEARHLAASGEVRERIAERLNTTTEALEIAFRRRGCRDEWLAIDALADVARTPYRY